MYIDDKFVVIFRCGYTIYQLLNISEEIDLNNVTLSAVEMHIET